MTVLEVCVDSLEGLERAEHGGAQRIELCARLDLGGLSPAPNFVELARSRTRLPIHVMVRPRAGDFVYSERELAQMREEIIALQRAQLQGVVFGVLTPDASVEDRVTRAFVRLARPMSVTFHRAFDEVADPLAELERLIDLGVDRVLTSGGAVDALEGAHMLGRLISRAGRRILVMPGGGVRAHNAEQLIAATGARELHSSTPFRMPAAP